MIKLPKWTRGSTGRHRATGQAHRGWEGREQEIRLLAEDPATATTMPIQGLPFVPDVTSCPVDQCPWPETEGDRPGDHEYWLLEHLRTHPPLDFLLTISRLRWANTEPQERT
jgi:hypothetical protein